MTNRLEGLDMTECGLALKSIAKFHALSYAKFGGDFERICANYPSLHNHERIFVPKDQVTDFRQAYVRQTGQSYFEALTKAGHPEVAYVVRDLLVTDPGEVLSRLHESVSSSEVKFPVICHGDYWINNLLFKYEPAQGSPIDMKVIDFQMARVGSRAIDLQHFLQTSPKDRLLLEKEDELLRIYFGEFVSVLELLDGAHNEFTLAQLKEEFDAYRYFGICSGLFYAQFLMVRPEDICEIDSFTGTPDETMFKFFSSLFNESTLKKVLSIAAEQIPKLRG